MTEVGILDTIRHALRPAPPPRDDADAKRADVEGQITDFAHQREAADATIAGWGRRTDAALRDYTPERTNLAGSLRRARAERGGRAP